MRRILLASILVLGCLAAYAGTPSVRKTEDSKYIVSVGETTLVVDAAQGGKVLSYKYKDAEIISQTPWPNAFGSTFWTSPQNEWSWPPVPEYDSAPYEAEVKDGALCLTGPVCEKYKYRILKEFKPDDADGAVVVTYTIVNESNATRNVAPWEITRVLNGGLIFFDAPLESIEAANNMGALNFKEVPGLDYSWFTCDESEINRKINADGKGWLAFADKGLLLVKKFPDLGRRSRPAPGEAEIQVYVNIGRTYIELEGQGDYRQVAPGESLTWTVRWYLVPVECTDAPSQALVDKIHSIVD